MPYHSAWEAEAAAAASMQSNDQVYLHTRSKTATINNKKQRRIEREQWIVSRECGIKQKKTMTNGATRTKHRRWQAMPCGNDWFYCGSYGAWRPGTIIKLHVYMHVCMHASSSNDPSIHQLIIIIISSSSTHNNVPTRWAPCSHSLVFHRRCGWTAFLYCREGGVQCALKLI